MIDNQEDFYDYQEKEEKPLIPDIKQNIMFDTQSHIEL